MIGAGLPRKFGERIALASTQRNEAAHVLLVQATLDHVS
jgi:hypothetical protein